jgi:isoquinoline 1-oxidoreductase beta subunit
MSGRFGTIARRTFLISAGVIGGGLLVGAGAVAARLKSIDGYKLPTEPGDASFGAWLIIGRDGQVSVAVPHQEMGQGIHSLAVLLAAEGLRLDPSTVHAVPAPVAARFGNPVMLLDGLPFDPQSNGPLKSAAIWTFDKILRTLGLQATGGSTSTRNIAEPIRACAAATLDMLTRAAAAKFNVDPAQLKISNGSIVAPDGKSAGYAELAEAASKLSPREIAPPALGSGPYAGKGIARADVPLKTRGQARFGIDTREKGQLFAAIRHAPKIGGKLTRASIPAGLAGVRGIVEGRDYVAVVADSFSNALAGLDRADIQWDQTAGLNISTRDVFAAYRAALDKGDQYKPRWVIDAAGTTIKPAGDKSADAKTIAATYDAPFLAHATMEPINATALVTEAGCKVWAGHQSPTLVQILAARAAGISTDAVEVVTPYLGGGFGRRADLDYVAKAVEIAKRFKGTPVQTIWTRDQDIRDDVYRPAAMADLNAVLDDAGNPVSFTYRIAAPSITDQFVNRIMPSAKGGLLADKTTVDGAVFPLYAMPNRSIENFTVDLGVPVGFWRSVGYSLNCFFMESFIDEMAVAAKVDPLVYRARLLAGATGETSRRGARLIERLVRYNQENPLTASAAGASVGRGFALTECFHSILSHAADVEIQGGEISVKKIFVAVDCGFAIDPPNVAAQVRSAVNFGLSAALFGKVEFENGTVAPKNFDDYPVLTLANAPRISVDILTSNAEIGGVGEIGTPGIAPAVGNAIFAATGKRLRSLPFTLSVA